MKRGCRSAAAAVLVLTLVPGFGAAALGQASSRQGTFEFFMGSYGLAEPLFEAVYGPGGSIRGIGLTARLISELDFYFEIRGMFKTGQLSHSKEKTEFLLIPVSLGLRWSYPIGFVSPFAGGGLDHHLFYERNPIGTTVSHARGGHIQGGAHFRFGRSVPLLPFLRVKRAWVKADSGSRTIDLGGWEFGAGIAVAF